MPPEQKPARPLRPYVPAFQVRLAAERRRQEEQRERERLEQEALEEEQRLLRLQLEAQQQQQQQQQPPRSPRSLLHSASTAGTRAQTPMTFPTPPSLPKPKRRRPRRRLRVAAAPSPGAQWPFGQPSPRRASPRSRPPHAGSPRPPADSELMRQVNELGHQYRRENTVEWLRRSHVKRIARLQRRNVFSPLLNLRRAQSELNVALENSLGHVGLDTHTLARLRMSDCALRNLAARRVELVKTGHQEEVEKDRLPLSLNSKQRLEADLLKMEEKLEEEAREQARRRSQAHRPAPRKSLTGAALASEWALGSSPAAGGAGVQPPSRDGDGGRRRQSRCPLPAPPPAAAPPGGGQRPQLGNSRDGRRPSAAAPALPTAVPVSPSSQRAAAEARARIRRLSGR
eukprot:TRINITY_DN3645_c0_g1_i4.p2 TRINITY_DN3645_c0_g1~~TRINITY_DN3645_c0_g1_i4.p2  ORF type:complete len:420 (+),score=141.57 TRINITY_DN3645_c0_g1_i4:64-1260(+)